MADVEKEKNSKVLGAIYNISKKDEKKLDVYEDYPHLYLKNILNFLEKKSCFIICQKNQSMSPRLKGILTLLNKVIEIVDIEIPIL